MRPRILLTCYNVKDSEMSACRPRGVKGQHMTMCTNDYINAVYKAGGTPIIIPSLGDIDYCRELLKIADGVLFTGGEDVHPKYYDEEIIVNNLTLSEERDKFEMALAEAALNADMPIFAICRGMQLLNVAAGGTLYQDIYEQADIKMKHNNHKKSKDSIIHNVSIDENSKLHKIYTTAINEVNSFHHQAVKKLADSFVPTAYSEDGLLEAYELKGDRFVLGVQWHPEMMFDTHSKELSIFKAFIEASRKK